MKASHYTSVYELTSSDKEKLIFNARTLALALIENDKLDLYNDFCANGTPIQDEKLLSDLKAGGFLLEDDIDEEAIIRHEQLCARYNTNQLSLVIAPTSNCNFRCVYCYERPVLRSSKMDEETQSLLFDKLTWKISNILKEENTASVEVEITNKDFNQIISNYTQEALKIAFSGESFTQEEQNNKLKEQLKNEEIGTKTVTTTIQLVKQDGEWKVQADESLVNALLPGLQEAINSLNSFSHS